MFIIDILFIFQYISFLLFQEKWPNLCAFHSLFSLTYIKKAKIRVKMTIFQCFDRFLCDLDAD